MTESADNQGYVAAFYEIADLMGIGAQAASPKEVFEKQMLPALRAALANRDLVLEEAAKLCDRIGGGSPDREDMTEYDLGHESGADHCASRIRHMQSSGSVSIDYVLMPRKVNYDMVERRFDTRNWEGEDYRSAQREYEKWTALGLPLSPSPTLFPHPQKGDDE